MKIRSIELCNYRLYKDKNRIEFENKAKENIHLILGENGFGKTTFLTSLLWCLYGKMITDIDDSFRKEIVTSTYSSFLIENLHNTYKQKILSLLSEEEQQEIKRKGYAIHQEYIKEFSIYSVSIEFYDISIPSIPCDSIKITRSYDFLRELEEVEILIDEVPSELSNEIGHDIFINDFIMSKDIARFFFFDSERIVSLADTNTTNDKRRLCSAYNSILGVKKYEDLNKNLEHLRIKFRKKTTDLESKRRLEELLKERENKIALLSDTEKELSSLEEKIVLEKQENEALQVKLLMEGNTTSIKDLDRLETLMQTLRKKDLEYKAKIKDFLDLAPFAISGNLLITTKKQVEQDFMISQSQNNLHNQNLLLEKINAEINEVVGRVLDERVKTELTNSFKNLINKYKNIESSSNILLNISKELYNDFNSLYNNIIGTYKTEFKYNVDSYKKNKQILDRTLRNINNLKEKENSESIKAIRNQKNIIEKNIEQLEQKFNSLMVDKELLSRELSTISTEISKLSKKVSIDDSDQQKDILAAELINSINHFLTNLKLEKKTSLEERIKKALNTLMHKKDFVHKVEIVIDGDLLEINLFDIENNIINKGKLSKGEQQLYASSLLQSFVEESELKFPVFIDSPLQKFDKNHANRIITEFYPIISNQVILFPLLHTEISNIEIEAMKPYINSIHRIKNEENYSYVEKIDSFNNLIS